MTNSIKDVCEDSQVILLVGSNPEEAHPVMGMRLRQAVERGAKLIVVDPREIGLAKKADIHLKLRPGTNVAFANGMVNVLIQKGLVDREFVESRTEGFDELAAMVADYTPERVAEICGIDARDLEAAAEMYATAERAPIVYCLGVVEHSTGTEGVMALSNLRHQPAARPEQRAGRMRHGRGPGRLHWLSEGGEPRDAREVRGRMGRRAEPGCRSEGH